MAQASSASAREPSMEEILASIRRIIEDSDSARRATDDVHEQLPGEAVPAVEAETRADFDDDAGEPAPEVEAFRSELAEPAFAETEQRSPELVVPMQQVNGAHPAPNVFDHHRSADELDDEPRDDMRNEPARPAVVSAAEDDQQPRDEGNSRGAIISDFAGRQVAAAFEELSDAFSASRKRSYDEIAEEIMRPMLQDWLDNNLPLLVERLVREEIERVARGGAR